MKLIKRDSVTSVSIDGAREHKYLKHLASAMSHYLENPMALTCFASWALATRRITGMPSKPGSPTTATGFSKNAWRGRSPLDYLIEA